MQDSDDTDAPMTTGDAARLLNLSVPRVQQLDAVLAPARTAKGKRIYSRRRVEQYALERREARSQPSTGAR
jgi:hypothetical protein